MNKFKSVIMSCHGKNKSFLHWLYNTHVDDEDEEKEFVCGELTFWFRGTGFRNPEKLVLSVGIPEEIFGSDAEDLRIPTANFVLHLLWPVMENLGKEYRNDKKDVREKAKFSIQAPDGCMDKKSGCLYNRELKRYVLQILFNVPLINGTSVNSKSAFRAVRDIMEHVAGAFAGFDRNELCLWQKTFANQECIRRYMKARGLCTFVADGSILPRDNGADKPMRDAKPFRSPESLRVSVTTDTGDIITGMGVKKGITVITGGGYSGKSTLLDAIESGIYYHVPGDGREYVLTDETALKTNAEDGRPVADISMEPFFRQLSGGLELSHFSTRHASGSVSQAANIVEAIGGGVKLLLIDEDKSATNFMIRDKIMRKIVPNEPIIPFTDRIGELSEDLGVSIILVIGGSAEYLAHADTVILMEDYEPRDITGVVRDFGMDKTSEPAKAIWKHSRRLVPKATTQEFLYFRSAVTENEKKIILDDYSADITSLTALNTPERLNTLMSVMEKLLTDKEADTKELLAKVTDLTNLVIGQESNNGEFSIRESEQRFYSGIRPIDAWCCINRMRGVGFKTDCRPILEQRSSIK